MMPAALIASAATGAIFRKMLNRPAIGWSPRRRLVVAAGMLPAILWLFVFGVDTTAFVQSLLHPNPEPGYRFMLSVMMLYPCGMAFCAGLAGAVIAATPGKR
jgi:hypothetical protein